MHRPTTLAQRTQWSRRRRWANSWVIMLCLCSVCEFPTSKGVQTSVGRARHQRKGRLMPRRISKRGGRTPNRAATSFSSFSSHAGAGAACASSRRNRITRVPRTTTVIALPTSQAKSTAEPSEILLRWRNACPANRQTPTRRPAESLERTSVAVSGFSRSAAAGIAWESIDLGRERFGAGLVTAESRGRDRLGDGRTGDTAETAQGQKTNGGVRSLTRTTSQSAWRAAGPSRPNREINTTQTANTAATTAF